MDDLAKQILTRPIQLADQVVKAGDEATINKQECAEIKSKTEKLAALLRQAARASSDLYERPTRRIIDDTENVLQKALTMVQRCRDDGYIMRLFNIIPAAAFRKMISQLENSVGDVSWLLRVSTPAGNDDDEGVGYLGLPPIAANEPILCLIWEQIAVLMTGSPDDKADAAASLASLAKDNPRHVKLIIEEGGVNPLLKLVKEGKIDGQENAARTIGLLGRDPESVEQMIQAGVCSVLANILKEGSMRVQAVVAWAVSELVDGNHAKCQELFAQNNVIRLLVSHLAFETVQEHSKYAVVAGRATSMHHAVVMASKTNTSSKENLLPALHEEEDNEMNPLPNQMHSIIKTTMAMKSKSYSGISKPFSAAHQSRNASVTRGRELEDPATKAYMKAMAARALWKLAVGNATICRVITESRALLCFAVLLEHGDEETKYNTAMAIMEITAVAEENADLRRSAFRRTSSACKAVVDQLFRIVENADAGSELLIPCVKSIGNLARTFKSAETHMIVPLVKLLDDGEPELAAEVAVALGKFTTEDNFLRKEHSKTIIDAGGSKLLVQLAYFGENGAQIPALILLSYVAMNVPDSEQLAKDEVLTVLERASKQGNVIEEEDMEHLLYEAKSRLELYQSRGARGFHV
ncbi:BnaAnng08380D [Brassica napus]|uniref:BnaAnng08380D protein n=1 Tax=Brassica napus TaxID=3708 RepID=A0A078I834_BRANA|nr:BnaAnng08380D [Brassica napus]